MHSVEFTRQLRSARQQSGLTKAEIARWFGRSYWTVNRWFDGTAPTQNREQAEVSLLLLLKAIEMGQLPLADNLRQQTRDIELGKVRDVIYDRLVKADMARAS